MKLRVESEKCRVAAVAVLMFGLCAELSAALPLPWRADWPNCKPVEKLLHRGVDVALQPTFYINGSLADTNGWNLTTYVQTNAVGAWFGPLPGAFFSHTNDVGAAFYNVMVRAETPGGSVNYTAFARFRMLDSPGFTPGELPLPAKVIDFADVTVLNPPWGEGGGGGISAATATNIAKAAAADATASLEDDLVQGSITVKYAENADNAEHANSAGNATIAGALSGNVDFRTGDAIFAQLDAATETNAQQSAALAAKASTNDVQLTPVYGGNGQRFSEWVVNPATYDGHEISIVFDSEYNKYTPSANGDAIGFPMDGNADTTSLSWAGPYEAPIDMTATRTENPIVGYTLGSQTNKVLSSTNDLARASDLAAVRAVADAAASTNAAQAAQITAIGAHLNAEDARFVSTNYNSETRMAEASVEVQVSNSWLTVWREMTRWNWFLGIYNADHAAIIDALADKGAREYAFYDGVTGEPAPDGFFWISQPRIAIAAGMSYQSYVDSAGAVWVLESNGMVADLNGTTNGYFRISDDEGNSQFEIVKGSSRTVGASVGALTRTEVMGVTHWHTTYAVTNAATAPVAMFCRDLTSGEWYAEADASCPVNVSWTSPDPGTYICEWWPKSAEPIMFMKAEYGQGSETRIRQVAPVEIQYIVIGGVKYALGTATISGSTVLTLTRQ